MTPAEELRAAAKLMRERATAATPGPWHRVAGIWHGETFAAVIGAKGDPEDAETWLMATGRGCREADAHHAASWHPLVALAVADWLDAEAVHYDDLAASPWGEAGAAFVAGDFGGDADPALKVARAYTGGPP